MEGVWTQRLFALDDPSAFSPQDCLVPKGDWPGKQGGFCLLIRDLNLARNPDLKFEGVKSDTTSDPSLLVVLRVNPSADVEVGTVVVQQWVADWLYIDQGGDVCVKFFPEGKRFTLTFLYITMY